MLTRNLKIAASVLAVFCFVAFGGNLVISPERQLAAVDDPYSDPFTGTYQGGNSYGTGGSGSDTFNPSTNSGTPYPEDIGTGGSANPNTLPGYAPLPPSRPDGVTNYSDVTDGGPGRTREYTNDSLFGQTNTTSGGLQNPTVGGSQNPTTGGSQNTGGGIITLQNPLKAKSIGELLRALIDIMIVFAIPLIVIMIIYAGFLYVTARGNESKITTAHWALTSAIIGGLLILGAEMLITVIQGTVNQLR